MIKLRNSKMMWSFLIFGTLLASIPVIILSIYIYTTSFRAIRENTHVMQRELLDGVREDIEHIIRTTDQQLFDMSLLSSTSDALNASNFKYNYITFDNIRLLKNRMIEIQSLITQRTGVEVEYTLVNTQGEWLQNNDGFYQFTVGKIQPILGIIRQAIAEEIPGRTPTGTSMASQDGYLQMVRPVWRGTTTYGALAIGIPESQLFSKIRSIPEMENMLILDDGGNQIAAYQSSLSRLDLQGLIGWLEAEGLAAGYRTASLANGRWVITVSPSDYLGWHYIYATDIRTVQPQSNVLIAAVIAITTSVLLVIGFAFFAFTRRMYRPIARLIQQVSNETDAPDNTDEWTTLSNYIGQVHASYHLLEQVQEDHKLQLTRQLLLQLVDGSIVHEWAVRRAETLGLPLTAHYFCLFLLELEQAAGADDQMPDGEVQLFLVRDIANELFPAPMANLHEMVEGRFLMLHQVTADTPAQAADTARMQAQRLMQVVSTTLQATPRCVIAGPFEALLSLPERYAEAIHTLEHRIGMEDDNIGFSTGEGLRRRAYSREAYRDLMKAIGRGDLAGAQGCLRAYFAPLLAADLSADEMAFERLSVATGMLGALKPQTYPSLLPLLSPETDACAWLDENLLIANLAGMRRDKPASISEKVFAMIEQEYQTPLTLEYCAEKIGYHPSYVSRIFKQQTGTSFKECLYLYRIEKAQELLVSTELQISEISNMLCYNNAQNFIRVFKKVVGTTPGAYRAQAREG